MGFISGLDTFVGRLCLASRETGPIYLRNDNWSRLRSRCIACTQFSLSRHLFQDLIAAVQCLLRVFVRREATWCAEYSGQESGFLGIQSFSVFVEELSGRILDTRRSRAKIRSVRINGEYLLLRETPSDMPTQPKTI